AILNNNGDLVCERWIVSQQIGNRQSQNVAVAVLMLQTLAGQRGSSRRASNQKSAAAHISRSPDQIPDALESEHRIIDKEGNRIDAVVGIGRARGDERAHGAGFGYSF